MRKNLPSAFLAFVVIFLLFAQCWIGAGLSNQLDKLPYSILIWGILIGGIPVVLGLLMGSLRVTISGLILLILCLVSLELYDHWKNRVIKDQDQKAWKYSNQALISKAQQVLQCEDGHIVVYSTLPNKDGATTHAMEVIEDKLSQQPQILCVKRPGSAAICRGLERNPELHCSNSEFSSLQGLRKQYFSDR